MEFKGSNGMEIEVVGKGLKRLQKGTKGASSSKSKASLAKHFEVQEVEPHRLSWLNTQTEAKDKLRDLGVGYLFAEPEECNLTL
ncbi:hypothetical protein HAX54_023270, partial [Datura stramonium]|nr:hypothetical protein [Datura stramonium]